MASIPQDSTSQYKISLVEDILRAIRGYSMLTEKVTVTKEAL
jgi:hypothetical protein